MGQTYRKSGVNVAAGEEVVRRIRKKARSTFTPRVLADIGAFGSFYRASFPGLKDPVLVSSVDGVGTKLKLAFALKRYNSVGVDLVNHCVNDIAVCGATPLYFLDYFATGSLAPSVAEDVIDGFVAGCRQNDCSLVGGETAEMPGIYAKGEFDLAGMIVGVVERKRIVDGHTVRRGDLLIGLPSTGLHTNGFSLARKVLLNRFSLSRTMPELGTSLGDALMAVHRSYLRPIRSLLERQLVRGMAHITGGGIVANTMRVVPRGLRVHVDWKAWERPALFRLIQEAGKVPEADVRRTFNLGVGLIFIVDERDGDRVLRLLRLQRERPVIVGNIVAA